ncbi:hypothetical protein EKM01_08115 [Flavobacterium sp. RSP46]|uniref:hypothetical protein n=1 Tax=Flavobacterium sp. RSP46 TaxID=2497486 RepID=UPI000F879238|nr:hypothetical protein [Flavobacterium sp. RSP46]RTY90997.1 hypothetical protein EKM01_08115 [Flavobacterium sp. RSP46]
MKNSEIIIATFFIIESIIICYFFYVYSNNEKMNKIQRENEIKELQNIILNKIAETKKEQEIKNIENINNQQTILNEISQQIFEKFEELSKKVKLFQEQSSAKTELGFKVLLQEYIKIKDELNTETTLIKDSFKDYSQNIETTISKYSEDNYNTKLAANKFKEELEQDLKSILMGIKDAKLDVDKFKEEMQQDLKNILMEIKEPLDLE